MDSGNEGAFLAARVLPQVINILIDLRHFSARALSPKDGGSLFGLCSEGQGNGGRPRWMDPAHVRERLHTGDDSIGIQFKPSPWQVLRPTTCQGCTQRWEAGTGGLDKGCQSQALSGQAPSSHSARQLCYEV